MTICVDNCDYKSVHITPFTKQINLLSFKAPSNLRVVGKLARVLNGIV